MLNPKIRFGFTFKIKVIQTRRFFGRGGCIVKKRYEATTQSSKEKKKSFSRYHNRKSIVCMMLLFTYVLGAPSVYGNIYRQSISQRHSSSTLYQEGSLINRHQRAQQPPLPLPRSLCSNDVMDARLRCTPFLLLLCTYPVYV